MKATLRYEDMTIWAAAAAGGMVFSAAVANLVSYYAEQLMEFEVPIEELFIQDAAVNLWTAAAVAEVMVAFSSVVFLVWIYKVCKNSPAFSREDSALWSAASFAIPVIQLWRPFIVVRRLWSASIGTRWGLMLTLGWWVLVLTTASLSYVAAESLSLGLGAEGGEQKRQLLMNGLELCAKAGYLQVASCVMTSYIVYSVTAMFRARDRLYSNGYGLPIIKSTPVLGLSRK